MTLVVKSASSCLSVRDLLGRSRQKSWMVIVIVTIRVVNDDLSVPMYFVVFILIIIVVIIMIFLGLI